MEKKKIISLAGDLASGKGTVSEILIKELGYGIYRNGEYARKLAKDMGLDITSFNAYLAEHPEIDLQIEKSASEYAKDHNEFIIDARLGWYAVPESFKVYLRVDIDVAAQRAFNDSKRKSTENFTTVEEQKTDMQKRYKLENERYFKLYNVHKDDMSNYDLVIDTTNMKPEEVAQLIINKYNKWLESN
jgi:CMP/dCMP kinase